jgi:hypothetical protein
MMSARKLGRLVGAVFALAVVLTWGANSATNVDAPATQSTAVQASTLILDWE